MTRSGSVRLLTTTPTSSGNHPNGDANVNWLTNVPGNEGCTAKAALPEPFASEFPFQSDVSDFLLYDLGNFAQAAAVRDCNAGTLIGTSPFRPLRRRG